MCPHTVPNNNYMQTLEAPGLHDANLKTLSIQTPRY